jgi:protein-L-isoaspartate(D-aspartate) O-methyltransferase
MSAETFAVLRQHMLAEISAGTLLLRGSIGKAAIDERVMTAMDKVPRHEFVPVELQPLAYANIPLPIGFDKNHLAAVHRRLDDGPARHRHR